MEIEPVHSFLVAAKSDFLSKHIKTGSFTYVNISKSQLREKETDSIAVNGEQMITAISGKHDKQMITASADKPFWCEICQRGFALKSGLKCHQHVHTRHNKPYKHDKCKTCDKQFVVGNKHVMIRAGGKPYVCETCDKCFTLKGDLNRHQRVHTGDRPYVCDTCGKSYIQKINLTTHRFIHTGERPYVCDICSKDFRDKGSLRTHRRAHIDDKPSVCNTCGECFTRKHHLTIHQRTHTGGIPYMCDTCGRCFTDKHSLTVHLRTHTEDTHVNEGNIKWKCTRLIV